MSSHTTNIVWKLKEIKNHLVWKETFCSIMAWCTQLDKSGGVGVCKIIRVLSVCWQFVYCFLFKSTVVIICNEIK